MGFEPRGVAIATAWAARGRRWSLFSFDFAAATNRILHILCLGIEVSRFTLPERSRGPRPSIHSVTKRAPSIHFVTKRGGDGGRTETTFGVIPAPHLIGLTMLS